MHHVQLKVDLPAHVIGLLPESGAAEIRLDRGSEQFRPRPADVETRRAEGLEPQRWNAPFEHRLGDRFPLQRVNLEARHAEQLAVALHAAIGAAVHVVIAEAAEIEVREWILARAGRNRSAREQPDGGVVERQREADVERAPDRGYELAGCRIGVRFQGPAVPGLRVDRARRSARVYGGESDDRGKQGW